MQFHDAEPIKGWLKVVGRIGDQVTTFVDDHNVITIAGRRGINYANSGHAPIDPIAFIAVGTGAYLPDPIHPVNPPAEAVKESTGLKLEKFRKPVSSITHTTDLIAVHTIEFLEDEAIGFKLNEFALLTRSGIAFALRNILSVTKIKGMILTIEWTIEY